MGRVYRDCASSSPPCDTWSGDEIIDGYRVVGHLTGVDGITTTGTVTETNGPNWMPAGPSP
ncbi:hypothetical protein [Kitasatospora sp. NPDC048407]|uniref:hypothetical protein n=1 Tax=Kitasatospora sp. NPDC048407 TaxID=3364051 RepID=UPI003717DD34